MLNKRNYLFRLKCKGNIVETKNSGLRIKVKEAKLDYENLDFIKRLPMLNSVDDFEMIIGDELYVKLTTDELNKTFFDGEKDEPILHDFKINDSVDFRMYLEINLNYKLHLCIYNKEYLNLSFVNIININKPLELLVDSSSSKYQNHSDLTYVYKRLPCNIDVFSHLSEAAKSVFAAIIFIEDNIDPLISDVNKFGLLKVLKWNDIQLNEAIKELEEAGIVKRLILIEY